MTTLYRPVLIESAAQAEALPVGTLATYWDGPRLRDHALKTDSILGPWEKDMRGYRHGVVIGWTALVPVEAEEEYKPDVSVIPPWPAPMPETLPNLSRYVTPWEAV